MASVSSVTCACRTASSRPRAARGAAADLDRERGALGGERRRDVGEADGSCRASGRASRSSRRRPSARPAAPGSRGARCPRRSASKPTSFRARPCCLLAHERVAPDEVALVELHDPAEARLERRRRLVDVVAVEREARLEPERVARAEAARLDRRRPRRPRRARPRAAARPRARQKSSNAVLAGVAGARDEAAARPRRRRGAKRYERTRREVERREPLEELRGERALQRELRPVVGLVPRRPRRPRGSREPLEVLLPVRRRSRTTSRSSAARR